MSFELKRYEVSIFLYKYRWMKYFFLNIFCYHYLSRWKTRLVFFFPLHPGRSSRSRSSWPRWWRPFWRCPGSPTKEIRWRRRWRRLPLRKLGALDLKVFVLGIQISLWKEFSEKLRNLLSGNVRSERQKWLVRFFFGRERHPRKWFGLTRELGRHPVDRCR